VRTFFRQSSVGSCLVSEAATGIPIVVTHRYHPVAGPYRNLCALRRPEAEGVIRRLLRDFGRSLKPSYLARRHATEDWLHASAQRVLEGPLSRRPMYFFLGDFSHGLDRSRPASLHIPLASLPSHRLTFTLGDSMSVATQQDGQVYSAPQLQSLFAAGLVSGFALSDRFGIQRDFIEVQLWVSAVAFPKHSVGKGFTSVNSGSTAVA